MRAPRSWPQTSSWARGSKSATCQGRTSTTEATQPVEPQALAVSLTAAQKSAGFAAYPPYALGRRRRKNPHDREESFRGICCVAAPLRGAGRAVAAVSVSSCRGERELARLGPAVLACARAVWREQYGPERAGRTAAARPQDPRPKVSEQEMDNMMGWLRFSEWM